MIDFRTEPQCYRHWRISVQGERADLVLDVDESGGLFGGYELKLNSYDLGVDIELNDAVQRLRFEQPQVKVVVIRSGKERVFSAGANIRMLASASHVHKVNFCKFTNETRNAIEDASAHSGQSYIAAISGVCAGGGYELALATEFIILADDANASVALPEVPLLGVLPGTGGLTRVTDKRRVRRDWADVFCTTEEGVKGKRALKWRLVDELVPPSQFEQAIAAASARMAKASTRVATSASGIALTRLERRENEDALRYRNLKVEIDTAAATATITLNGPSAVPPSNCAEAIAYGDAWWPLALARELDDALLHLRFNEPDIGLIVFRCHGDADAVLAHDRFMAGESQDWFVHEVRLLWKRVLKRLDLTARSLFALVEPDSCFAGFLAEILLACDRSYMLIGADDGDNRRPATVTFTAGSMGEYPMSNGLSRLQTRFLEDPSALDAIRGVLDCPLDGEQCEALGLVTFALDDIDWDDEVRIALEERASFSPDALTGLEANLRFAGPETMETRIFGRLSAWQNWIFQRPGVTSEDGALKRYGSGRRAMFPTERV